MAQFIKLKVTEYDDDGAPAIDVDEQWINIDQITHIEEHLGNNLIRRHAMGGWMPEEHYPCLLITTSDGRNHLATLGTYSDSESGMEVLDRFMMNLSRSATSGSRAAGSIVAMTARVSPIRPDLNDDGGEDELFGADWMSTAATVDPATGERADPFETVRPVAPNKGPNNHFVT